MADLGKVIKGEDDEVEEELEWSGSEEEEDGEESRGKQLLVQQPASLAEPPRQQQLARPDPETTAGVPSDPSAPIASQAAVSGLAQLGQASAAAPPQNVTPSLLPPPTSAAAPAQPAAPVAAELQPLLRSQEALAQTVSATVLFNLGDRRMGKHLARQHEEFGKTLQAVQSARYNLSSEIWPSLEGLLQLAGQTWENLASVKLAGASEDSGEVDEL